MVGRPTDVDFVISAVVVAVVAVVVVVAVVAVVVVDEDEDGYFIADFSFPVPSAEDEE